MKIITLHTLIDPKELREHIRENLDRMFAEYRKVNIHFAVGGERNIIEISEPGYYGLLYHIEVKDDELHITWSEHYVDDVNSLTVESILNDLFKDLSGKLGTDLLQEG